MTNRQDRPRWGSGFKSNWSLAIAFSAICFVLLPFYPQSLTPDPVSYLSIAKHYAAGFFGDAINDYWSPLYSWLTAGLLVFRVPDILAARIVGIGAGALTLVGLNSLSRLFALRTATRVLMLSVASILTLSYVFEGLGPDLLFTALLLCYCAIIFSPRYHVQPFAGALCGMLGGLAYLAKAYGLPFFMAHFALFSLLHWRANKGIQERRQISIQFVRGMAVFCVIAGAWIVALHSKYGSWTPGTTGEFNHRLVGPESNGYPQLRELKAPPSPHAITAWEEPLPSWLKPWNVFASAITIQHEAKLIYGNAKVALLFLLHVSFLLTCLLPAFLVLCLKAKLNWQEWTFPLLSMVLFVSGYLLITAEERYFWLTGMLSLLIGFYALELLSRYPLGWHVKSLAVMAVTLSFLITPARSLRGNFRREDKVSRLSGTARMSLTPGSRVASCNNWADSAYLAYLLDARYFGVILPTPDADEIAKTLNPDFTPAASTPSDWQTLNTALESANVQYLFVWPGCSVVSSSNDGSGLQILRVPVFDGQRPHN